MRFSRVCSLSALGKSSELGFSSFLVALLISCPASGQILAHGSEPGETVALLPSDQAIFEAGLPRKDLPCSVSERKPQLGFDMRFHAGYEVTIPLSELTGSGELLTVVFRVFPQNKPGNPSYFVQHFNVPDIPEDAKGDTFLDGVVDLGEGLYHVDWLMRDRAERICASSWDVDAALSPKDRPVSLFLPPNQIAALEPEPFFKDSGIRNPTDSDSALNIKLLVNFAPQNAQSSSLQRTDTDALVSILKTIERDPHVGRISLVAFNMSESRVVYRQEAASEIDFPSLGRALQTVKLGTVAVQHLGEKHRETDFLQNLIHQELETSSRTDAVIFAGPKAMLAADVPQEDLRRIGDVECPVFYMNYNLNPQAVPWKDSISHAIKAFKGTEYTISRPRDLWVSTSEMVNRILREKRTRGLSTAIGGGSR